MAFADICSERIPDRAQEQRYFVLKLLRQGILAECCEGPAVKIRVNELENFLEVSCSGCGQSALAEELRISARFKKLCDIVATLLLESPVFDGTRIAHCTRRWGVSTSMRSIGDQPSCSRAGKGGLTSVYICACAGIN